MSKQSELKGIEKPKLRDVEDAADDYLKACDKIKALREDKSESAEKLLIALHRNKIKSYAYDGHVFSIEELEKVKVKAVDDDDDADEDPS